MSPTQGSLPDSLQDRYALVCDRVARATERAGRRREDAILVAVTKTAEPEQIRELIGLGHRDFGESRVQQLIQRAAMVDEYLARLRVSPGTRRPPPPAATAGERLFPLTPGASTGRAPPSPAPVRWHMIGHLQRNKARKVVDHVRLIHSVDSLRLAEELQGLALKRDRVIEVLVQVNCSGEATKSGCPVPAALALAEQIGTMVNVRARGLMTMAAPGASPEDARPSFARAREIFDEIAASAVNEGQFNLLSMGMSGDYEVAIAEGANLVRVGTAIFGPGRPDAATDETGADED